MIVTVWSTTEHDYEQIRNQNQFVPMKQVLPPGEFVQMFEKNKKGKISAHTCSSSYFSITGGAEVELF